MSNTTIVILTDSEDESTNLSQETYQNDTKYLDLDLGDDMDETEEEDPSEDEVMGHEEETQLFPTTPLVPQQRTPSYKPFRNHPNGPLMMYTPRKRVLPTQEVSPTTNLEPNPTRGQRTNARKWGWMPHTLQEWRSKMGIPSQHEVGESSTTPSIPSFTQEPIHHTVPLLVAKVANHDTQLAQLHQEIGRNTSLVNRDMHDITIRFEDVQTLNSQNLQFIQQNQTILQTVIDDLRHRLEECEERNARLTQRINALEHGETAENSHS